MLRGGIESVEAKAGSDERHGDDRQLEDGPTQGLNAAKVVDARTRHSGVGLAQWRWVCMHCVNCQLELIHNIYIYVYAYIHISTELYCSYTIVNSNAQQSLISNILTDPNPSVIQLS